MCGAAVLRGADIYVPGILAAAQDVGAGDEVQVFVNTRTRVLRGAKTPDILEECRFIARGVAKYARSGIFSSDCPKSGVGVAICWTEWRHPNFNAWPEELRDLVFAQNLPAILVGHVAMNALANGPNKNRGRSSDHVRALDMCAAPGGKATHLASLLGDSQGTVVAVDRSRRRLQAVEENFRRLGLKNGHTFCHDSTKLGNLVSADSASSGDRPAAFGTETYDVVLLDPPCSALGQRPVFRVEATDETVLANVVLQKALFRQAVDLLGPNGVLVYSTCTLSLEENEDVVHWALLTFGCLDLIPALPKLGGDGHRKSNLSPEERGMVQRFAPPPPTENSDGNCNVDCVGFFVACFRKKSGDLCV